MEASLGEGMDESLRLPISGSSLSFRLPEAGLWRLCLQAEGLWAACRTLEAKGDGDLLIPVTFTTWPEASLAGRLHLEGEEELPEALEVSIGPSPGPGPASALEETTLRCPLGEEGRFECSIPATSFFAAVRQSGFVTRYFWDLEPSAGEQIDLGLVRLLPGASLVGTVDLATEGLEAGGIAVRLVPAVGPGTPAAIAGRVEKTARSAKATSAGFFQFTDVEPGTYMVAASHPSFATSSVGPVEVFPGKETALRAPIRLLPPIQLDLLIAPPTALGGRPWRVEVFRARDWSAGSDRVFRGEAESSGSVRVPDQSPGLFSITISDEFGNRFYNGDVRLEQGASGFVPIDVPLLRVAGTLHLGGEPAQGWVMFGGRHGAERSRMRADDEGRFEGLLPREGKWEVDVRVTEPPIETATQVEVVAGPDGTAEVDIDLDDTELHGSDRWPRRSGPGCVGQDQRVRRLRQPSTAGGRPR